MRCASPLFLGAPGSPLNLDVLLNVCDARDLRLPDVKEGRLQHSYLVIRTPWCTEEKVGGVGPVDGEFLFFLRRGG